MRKIGSRWEVKEPSTEWVDNGKSFDHLPMGQIFGIDPVAAEGERGANDRAVPK
jgi:hypothetical protein